MAWEQNVFVKVTAYSDEEILGSNAAVRVAQESSKHLNGPLGYLNYNWGLGPAQTRVREYKGGLRFP